MVNYCKELRKKLKDRSFLGMFFVKRDNRGTTLIEVIVALLILTLIFTPAYMAFSAALKLNSASKNQLYSQTIAKNAMEIVKYSMDAGIDYANIDFSTLGGSAVNADGSANISPVVTSGAAVTSSAIYEFTSCPEGTSLYDVKITVTDQEGKAKQNIFADMSAFNSTATALINPSGVSGGDDSSVAEYFAALHSSYNQGENQNVIQSINSHNQKVINAWNDENIKKRMRGEPEDPMPAEVDVTPPFSVYNLPDPTLNPDTYNDFFAIYGSKRIKYPPEMSILSKEELLKLINKKMYVKLNDNDVWPRHTYILDSTTDYYLRTNTWISNGVTKNIMDPDHVKDESDPMKSNRYCNDVKYKDLDNLYIMYTPLNVSGSGVTVELKDEKIEIENNLPYKTDEHGNAIVDEHGNPKPVNVFVVIQLPEGKELKKEGGGLDITVTGSGIRPLEIFCKTEFTGSPEKRHFNSAEEIDKKYSLINDESKQEIIYEVKVEVTETGTGASPISLVSSVSKN